MGWFEGILPGTMNHDVRREDFFRTPTEDEIRRASIRTKRTARQCRIVYELDRLHRLRRYIIDADAASCRSTKRRTRDQGGTSSSEDEVSVLEKQFRILVKKR